MYDILLYANYVFLSSTDQCFYKYFINYVQEVIISLVAIIRLIEPHVFSTLRYELKSLCSLQKIEREDKEKEKKRRKKELSNEALCTFVNSAMNVEYVSLILLGINEFMGVEAEHSLMTLGNEIKIEKEYEK